MGKKINKPFFVKTTKTRDILSLFNDIQRVISTKPGVEKMFKEVQMMKFKIKPIQGDISAYNLKNEEFIESLWSLGKLDEFYYKEFPNLSKKDQVVFLKIFDNLYVKYQQQLNQINLQPAKVMTTKSSLLELEIFKERRLKKKVN